MDEIGYEESGAVLRQMAVRRARVAARPGAPARAVRRRAVRRHRRPRQPQAHAGALRPRLPRRPAARVFDRRLRAQAAQRPGHASAFARRHRQLLRHRHGRDAHLQRHAAAPCATCRASSTTRRATSVSPTALGRARPHQAHRGNRIFYLATPPSLFPVIIERLGAAGLQQGGAAGTPDEHGENRGWMRVVIEKPFGRDLESARALNAGRARRVRRAAGLPHRPLPGQRDGAEHPRLSLRQRHLRADLEPALHRSRADHRRRDAGRRAPGRLLRRGRRAARHDPEPPAAAPRADGHGAAGRLRAPTPCATRRSRCCTPCGPSRWSASTSSPCAASTSQGTIDGEVGARLPAGGAGRARLHDRDLRRREVPDRQLALAGRALLRAHRQAPAEATSPRSPSSSSAPPFLLFREVDMPGGPRGAQRCSSCASSPTRASPCASRPRCPGQAVALQPVDMDFSYGSHAQRAAVQRLRDAAARLHGGRPDAVQPRRPGRGGLAGRRARSSMPGRRRRRAASPSTRPAAGGRRRPTAWWRSDGHRWRRPRSGALRHAQEAADVPIESPARTPDAVARRGADLFAAGRPGGGGGARRLHRRSQRRRAPRAMYRMLARQPFTQKIPWRRVHLYWGDERCVPPDRRATATTAWLTRPSSVTCRSRRQRASHARRGRPRARRRAPTSSCCSRRRRGRAFAGRAAGARPRPAWPRPRRAHGFAVSALSPALAVEDRLVVPQRGARARGRGSRSPSR